MAEKIIIDINLLTKKYDELNSVHKTADHFKCSSPTICRILKENGIPVNKKPRPTPERLKQLSDKIKNRELKRSTA